MTPSFLGPDGQLAVAPAGEAGGARFDDLYPIDPGPLLSTIAEWRLGRADDRGEAAADAIRQLKAGFEPGMEGHGDVETLLINDFDLDPEVTAHLLERGRWKHLHPPALSAHGRAVLGGQRPWSWGRPRAHRSSDYVLSERPAGPATPTEYAALMGAARAARHVTAGTPFIKNRRFQGVRDVGVIAALGVLGLRAQEVSDLKAGDYDRVSRRLTVRWRGSQRVLPVPPNVAAILDDVADARDKNAVSFFPTCDRDLRTCAGDPDRTFAWAVVDRRWADHVAPTATPNGSGDDPTDDAPAKGPTPSDLRDAVEAHLSSSPGISKNGVAEAMGRASRRRGARPAQEERAIRSAFAALDNARANHPV